MGVILGYMKLFGASAIGFDPLAPVGKRKSPEKAQPSLGKKGGRPKGRASHSRKPLMEGAREFIKLYREFEVRDFHKALSTWSLSARSKALMLLVKEKAIKRIKLGVYRVAFDRVTNHLKLAKAA